MVGLFNCMFPYWYARKRGDKLERKLRRQIVPDKRHKSLSRSANPSKQPTEPKPARLTWAERLKRAFEFDVTVCPLCGRTLRVISDITDPALIDRILTHIRQSRAPPARVGFSMQAHGHVFAMIQE